MKLRDYQEQADRDIHAAWEIALNVLYVAPCRSGKTVQMAHTIQQNEGSTIVIAHRAELVAQSSLTLARFGIYHRIIGPVSLIKSCSSKHISEGLESHIRNNAEVAVASVDTLVNQEDPFFKRITLWITDEAHHLLADNKWGKATEKFPSARGLGVTATPCRADGAGLGAHADGVFHTMVQGPTMRELIERGSIAKYKIICAQSDIDLTEVKITAGGDFSGKELSAAVRKSHIVGDVVQAYLAHAQGKLGITFACDIESATEISRAYNDAGVTAAVISSKTDAGYRRELQRRHQAREIMMLVNVDLFGEGVDIQMLECVVMARPTASYGLYIQQFCRPLNPDEMKPYGLIIDLVGNVLRHRLPDSPRVWSLDRREKRSRSAPDDVPPIRVCPECLEVYERTEIQCPHCGHKPVPGTRSSPEAVDGDLAEMSEELLEKLRRDASKIDQVPSIPYNASLVVQRSIEKRHRERIAAQMSLRSVMAQYGGYHSALGRNDREIQRRFFLTFGIDVLSAQGLTRAEAVELENKVKNLLTELSTSATLSL